MTVKTPAELKTLYESISFDLQTTYTGPLGQEYAVSGTHLRLWAPTAQRVEISLYRKGSGGEPIGTLPLERGQQGVWSIYLPGDQHGRYYTYTVTVDGISRQTGDPYARAAGVNGTRSMIVDLARTAPSGWERDVRPVIPPEQRAVWEVSVRDFSQDAASGVRPAWRGQVMALTPPGPTPAEKSCRIDDKQSAGARRKRFAAVYHAPLSGISVHAPRHIRNPLVAPAETVKARRNEQQIYIAQVGISRHLSFAAQRAQKMLESDYIAASRRRKSELLAHAFFAGER